MPKTVMIVEDYDDVRMMMKVLINWYGYDVIEATNGYEAIEKSTQQPPDLILMDLALPLMDGATAMQLIRKIDGLDKISIVAVTAYGNTSFNKAIEAGFDDVLIKPLHFENLQPILHHYLS
jgi:two-component system cell cycle response regulator DivK